MSPAAEPAHPATRTLTAAGLAAAYELSFTVAKDHYEAVRDCSGMEAEMACESCGQTFKRGVGWMVFGGNGGAPVCEADLLSWLTDPAASDALPTGMMLRVTEPGR